MSARKTAAAAAVTAAIVATAATAAVTLGEKLAWEADAQLDAAIAEAGPDGIHEPLLAMNCDSQIVYDESCELDLPKELGGESTSRCTFRLECCGAAVQKWTTELPNGKDSRGRIGHSQRKLAYSCSVSPVDVDGDGVKNFDDPYPADPATPIAPADGGTTIAVHDAAPSPSPSPSPTPSPVPTSSEPAEKAVLSRGLPPQ